MDKLQVATELMEKYAKYSDFQSWAEVSLSKNANKRTKSYKEMYANYIRHRGTQHGLYHALKIIGYTLSPSIDTYVEGVAFWKYELIEKGE
jgi:hypothetical protein